MCRRPSPWCGWVESQVGRVVPHEFPIVIPRASGGRCRGSAAVAIGGQSLAVPDFAFDPDSDDLSVEDPEPDSDFWSELFESFDLSPDLSPLDRAPALAPWSFL